ncbi:MAG: hypothetical protein ACE5F3_02995 [Mariprofundaceae bacterium]
MSIPIIRDMEQFEGWALTHQNEARIYVEGDSWFAYPGTNIITEIHDDADGDPIILQRAVSGDEAASMLSGNQRHTMVKEFGHLKQRSNRFRDRGSNARVNPDFILFSGGGNDMVGMFDFPMLIRKRPVGSDPKKFVRQDRFKNRLEQIKLSFIELGFIRDEFFKDCPIITHKYDLPIPSDKGVEFIGIPVIKSWMKPYMDGIGITNPDDQKGIAHYLIKAFGDMVDGLQQSNKIKHFYVIDTHHTLGPNDWQNEIHPTPEGFGWIATMFRNKMKQLRPDLSQRL